jgi:hypothetical protein
MMTWLLFCVSLGWSKPASSVVLFRSVLEKDSSEVDGVLGKEHLQVHKVNPLRRHAIADAMMMKPSFLAMLNRYGLGQDVVRDVAQGKKDLFLAKKTTAHWFWLKNNNDIDSWMLVVTRKEMYPEKNPFSRTRNDVLFDSIRHMKLGCRDFMGEIDGTLRRWVGQNCSYGNIWMEWDPTREGIFRMLVQPKVKQGD